MTVFQLVTSVLTDTECDDVNFMYSITAGEVRQLCAALNEAKEMAEHYARNQPASESKAQEFLTRWSPHERTDDGDYTGEWF